MRKQLTNFSKKERVFNITKMAQAQKEISKQELELCKKELIDLKTQLMSLLLTYPRDLRDEVIKENAEKLNKYAEKNLISKENCYNYSDTVKSDSPIAKQLYYGVRITPEEEPSTNRIVITKYGFNTANRIIYKSQLKLKTKEGVIIDKDMTLVSRNMNCHISKKDKVKVKRAGIRMSV